MPYRLIYASAATTLNKQDIEDILNESERHNPRHGLTGALIFNSRFFMQMLEGDRLEVDALYTRIREDHRHRNARITTAHKAGTRLFGDWSMRYFDGRQAPAELGDALSSGARFQPRDVTAAASLRLMEHLAAA